MNSASGYRTIVTGFGRLEAPTPKVDDLLLVSDVTLGGVHEVDLRSGEPARPCRIARASAGSACISAAWS